MIMHSTNGIATALKYFARSAMVSPPKIAGTTYGEMGFNTSTISAWNIARGIRPIAIIMVVTMELTAIEMVDNIFHS